MLERSEAPRFLLVSSLLTITLWGFAEARTFLIPLCFAALLAVLMLPMVKLLARIRMPQWLAILTSILIVLLPAAALVFFAVGQAQNLSHDFPEIVASVRSGILQFANSPIGQKIHVRENLDLGKIAEKVAGAAGQGVGIVVAVLGVFASAGSMLALTLIFAALMVAAREHLLASVNRILEKAGYTSNLAAQVYSMTSRFLLARAAIVGIVSVLDFTALSVMGVKYGLILAVFLGVATLVPAVGYIISAIPTMIVAYASGLSTAQLLVLFGALTVVSAFEGHYLSPKMLGRQMNLSLLATLVGLFAGERLWGVWGMFLAVPIMGVVRILLEASPRQRPWSQLLSDSSSKQNTKKAA